MQNKLNTATNEKDVENIYRAEILNNVSKEATITSPYNVDGLLTAKNVRTLLEFKYNKNLKNKLDQSSVLIQCLYYIKKFEKAGEKLPSTIFVGDKNECFALHTNDIVEYLGKDIDWEIAPSSAHKQNPDLLKAMVNDQNISPFVFDVNANFNIKDVLFRIKNLSDSVIRKVRITKSNINSIFDYFDDNVMGNVSMTTNEKANLFIQIVIAPSENYLHPTKTNSLIAKNYGEVRINSNVFKSFFKHFEGDVYTPQEKEEMTSIIDRLLEDDSRRRSGEFYTRSQFADHAHKYLTDVYGEDWKERFVVFDSCWGTGNLTRDYKFKELYVSTLEQSDLDTANQMGYNPEATKFQYDFLNDEDKDLPEGLKQALEGGKEVLFLINPPYATANVKSTTKGTHRSGVSTTRIGQEMRETKEWGRSTQNIYAQFLYRIWKYQQTNKNIHIGLFCKPNYLSGGSYDKFRQKFFGEGGFGFEKGFLFQASHFADVSSAWGINFAVLSNKPNDKNVFEHKTVDLNNYFEIEEVGIKDLYNVDGKIPASAWVRQEVKGLKTFDAPQISSALGVKQKGRGNLVKDALGYLQIAGNSVERNAQQTTITSGAFSNGNGLSITKNNLLKTSSLFTARKSIKGNWINDKDEYFAPNEEHISYNQFQIDSLVYSLFNSSSQQSSLRDIEYKDQSWDIKNEFFWIGVEQIKEIANENMFDEMYQDARTSSDRYMHKVLNDNMDKLSPQARKVLKIATDLTIKSMGMRKLMSESQPELYLSSWDAGWAQVKRVLQQYYKEEYNTFRVEYKKLEEQMIPLVYELGFLRR